jgi:secretion/DNA translocation related TadE-like protein
MTDRRDRGAASVVVIGVIAALLLLTAAALALASAVAASHQARLAADLGAVAGAMRLQEGTSLGSACDAAAATARDNGARMTRCVADGENVSVTVEVEPARWPAPAVARARAGPDRS